MNRAKRLAAIIILALAAPAAYGQKSYKELTYPKLREITMPKVERHLLANGMVLYLLEDHELPLVWAQALIRTGARLEPADKVGLAGITGEVMRTGGTESKTGDEIDEELERIAASVESSIGREQGSASMSVLKKDLDKVLPIFAEMLMRPAFRQEKVDLAKLQRRTAISRRNDNPISIASREFVKEIYGPDSPYARTTEYWTIDNIKREDLVAFHKRFYHPNNVILGVWGDFQADEMKAKIEAAFKDWQPSRLDLPPLPEVKAQPELVVGYIEKPEVTQANLRLGHIGGRLDDPDFFALDIMANVLGGGFFSRLFRRVRTELGLAYAVGASWNAEYDYPGTFSVFCNTKLESTVQAAQEIISEIKKLVETPVSEQELRTAKDNILNSFVFNFDTRGEVITRLMNYEYYGYPQDFLQRYRAGIEKTTAADVLAAARKHLRPDKLTIVVLGNDKKFDKPLATLGPVKKIDISIPTTKPGEKKEKLPEATPESLERGRRLLERTLEAIGGERVAAVKDLTIELVMNPSNPQAGSVAIKTILLLPDKLRREVSLPMGKVITIYDGKSAWAVTPRGTIDLGEEQKAELRRELFRNSLMLLKNLGSLEPRYLESSEVNGKKAEVVLIPGPDDTAIKLYLDSESGMILKKAYRSWLAPSGGMADVEEEYLEYQELDGVKIPHKVIVKEGGAKAREHIITSARINGGVSPELFTKQ